VKGFFLLKIKKMKKLLKKIKSIFLKEYDDKKLIQYRYEMNQMGNDGWTKLHYKNLYKKRLKELKQINK
jgi:hypothetical protein